jgi:hypothetical protein
MCPAYSILFGSGYAGLGVAESGSFRPLLSDPLPTGRRRFETAILKAVTTSE